MDASTEAKLIQIGDALRLAQTLLGDDGVRTALAAPCNGLMAAGLGLRVLTLMGVLVDIATGAKAATEPAATGTTDPAPVVH